jgi:flagellin FlaB
MYNKFCKAIKNLHHGQKGITGLETAIILIAFVTVASVLAYSVLSAGIFSSERGKAAVYSGLQSAQSTMSLKGSVVGKSNAGVTELESLTFNLALAIAGDSVDLTLCVFNYWDSVQGVTALTLNNTDTAAGEWSYDLVTGSGSILAGTDEAVITVWLPTAAAVDSYDTFTVQINPPTGASITLQRTLPPIAAVMTLN